MPISSKIIVKNQNGNASTLYKISFFVVVYGDEKEIKTEVWSNYVFYLYGFALVGHVDLSFFVQSRTTKIIIANFH